MPCGLPTKQDVDVTLTLLDVGVRSLARSRGERREGQSSDDKHGPLLSYSLACLFLLRVLRGSDLQGCREWRRWKERSPAA